MIRLSTASASNRASSIQVRRSVDRTAGSILCSVETSRVTVSTPTQTKQLTLKVAATNLPHPSKAHYGGEDAFFVSPIGGGAIGIADGVGGWQESGINPAEYSRQLMETARGVLEGEVDVLPSLDDTTDFCSELMQKLDQGEELQLGQCVRTALAVAHSTTKLPGSATACVLRLDQEEKAIVASNLGDSGFIVIRNKHVIFKTKPLEHFFDCPFQFGAYPEHTDATDTVDDAEHYKLEVHPGDIIIAGTDGLWDNCYEHEMMELLPQSQADVEKAADDIAALARSNSENPDYESPYSTEALNVGLDIPIWEKLMKSSIRDGKFELGKLQGGKQDDITVVVAYVMEEDVIPVEEGAPENDTAVE